MLIDNWIGNKIGLRKADALTREKLEEYQLFMLQQTLKYVHENSTFYTKHFNWLDPKEDVKNFEDFSRIPFTTPEMLREHGQQMICVPQSKISRIVTLDTSGSTGDPKRIFFTEEDQELTKDYFHYGLRVMVNPDDVFLILLPCKTPGSVGDLIRIGLERDGVKVIPFGLPSPDQSQDEEVINLIEKEKVTSLVGMPTIVARLAIKSAQGLTETNSSSVSMRTALLSAEYVSQENVDTIEKSWNCEVFEHYGMTETGLGGAMACGAHVGYHPREADLFFEIIDPTTGKVLPEGEWGEIVFTTLTRKGMPLIRYRTGDTTRWIPGSCTCGSILKRMDRVRDRGVEKNY